MTSVNAEPGALAGETAILQLLGQRYGDGLVYLTGSHDRNTFERAMNLGLISLEGYLTPQGRSYWQHGEA